MSESGNHQLLVDLIIRYVRNEVGEEFECFIESDISDGRPLPHLTTEGFRPDVCFEYNNRLIIGEAKTSKDVVNKHSVKQYKSYLKKCALYSGKATFLLAVPWQEEAEAYNTINGLKKLYPGNYHTKIIKAIL